jgi:uncharacterized membrane protein YgdD (TMEM256/DUF423 family)
MFMIKSYWPLLIGGFIAALAVAMNALGAHAFVGLLDANGKAALFSTALHMHEMHAIGLLIIGTALLYRPTNRLWIYAAFLMLVGQMLFCGNLYLLSLFNLTVLSMLTPIGGLCLMTSWVLFALGAVFSAKPE